ncbi:MAG TPA: arsenate reductase ArsC [Burkholderiales bacterium]|jgi:arsenate reductase|nr:arsenate reductase ArsC [Burkholderiales bacterium]
MKPITVLFLCTGNSARSIMSEAYLNAKGGGRFAAYSAGSRPTGAVNPLALQLLEQRSISTKGLASKSWNEFAKPGAPQFNFVITVCDSAAAESCPVWPGHPSRMHFSIPDPAAVEGDEARKREAFEHAFSTLAAHIDRFVSAAAIQAP